MEQHYTSQGIINDYSARKRPILVYFHHGVIPYKDFGDWIVCTLLEEQEVDQAIWADFLVHVEISAQANALRIVGSDDAYSSTPNNKRGSFRGSDVAVIEAYKP